MPPSTWSFLDHPGPLPFAHRGGAGAWPENTMPAFEGAIRLGYRYLETDAHVTADGVCLAFHDDRLDRVTDRTGIIADLSHDEVSKARVDGREPIPLLADLLSSFPDARINIDTKSDASVDAVADVVRQADAVDRVCIGSFSDARLERIRSLLGPALCTSMGPREVARLRGRSYGLPVGSFHSACAQVPHRVKGVTVVDERLVAKAHSLGLQVHVWTIDDEAEMNELLDLGVDGIMTDLPEVLKSVLISRGAWY